ncbi:hypothetical protein CHU32_11355 [Superficieibacter electus]|uniref:Uncharacterized protein n=1 Tax=Superficieibacter electus TaxID=2022662 RepID=A0A2P5GQ89_9ENTR|nr:hypothetical protein CHU33_08425 [Superficieibacter electus]POP48710.1 hypothetical protein CHU32_11355 [Superficieibacter electus]
MRLSIFGPIKYYKPCEYNYKHPNAYSEDAFEMNKQLWLNENAAHGIEDSFWHYYNKNKTG